MSSRLLAEFYATRWAILPSKLQELQAVAERWAAGEDVSTYGAAMDRQQATAPQGVAILPLRGSIFPRANMMTAMSGATSAEMWRKQFDALIDDPAVGAIVIDVDSPGGAVSGIEETANAVYAARGSKPVVAVANYLAASAAYWIATAADELVVSPSAEVGSIGVFTIHEDWSKALEADGIDVTIVKAGRHKAEGNPYQPLGEETQAYIQSMVDDVYATFVGAVARHRAVETGRVMREFGEGRVVGAHEAVRRGMADRVATLDDVIEDLLEDLGQARGARADTDFRRRRLRHASQRI